MIRLSRMADYAIVIAAAIAENRDVLYSAQSLAALSGLGLPTVSKILKQLLKAGILTSVRGSQGGYRLSAPASEISITQLVEAVDGPIALTECVDAHRNHSCHIESICGMKTGWDTINEAVKSALAGITLADFQQTPRFAFEPSEPSHLGAAL